MYLVFVFEIVYLVFCIWYLGQSVCEAPAADLSALYSFPSFAFGILYLYLRLCIRHLYLRWFTWHFVFGIWESVFV